MTFDQIALFLGAAFLLALAPGPDNLGVLALGISRGRAEALGFALGCAAGCINHTLLAVLGVSALIAASPLAFKVLQMAGAAYLIWIGIQALRSRGTSLARNRAPQAGSGFRPYFMRGLIANAINPKVGLFFLSFLPQFVRHSGWSTPAQLAAFGALFAVMAALVFGTFAMAAGPIGTWLRRRERVTVWLDRTTGGLFVGLGLLTAGGIR
ncbi:LysE family translocator [Niveibacterium umoris]|uniref:Threonine/homoserine/homoserine lactone efflux protein n=1 Tax=Niveibacterium umoris TaxID=1193620 RepID=A0A840BJV2_9RHOO|nr:LysE family translocator [Niveibacterium umoris]MBB4011176.1 threonine/homoserine/homoserine lactone efflux protein [Niveibacterium umoris]